MPDIILTTFNSRYTHTGFGLRSLLANLGELRSRAEIVEFELSTRPVDAVESLLRLRPRIVGLGVYIWNAVLADEFAQVLKAAAPEVTLVLGGPEVSHETDRQRIAALADVVICGEGERAFPEVCRRILAQEPLPSKVVQAEPPPLAELELPYELYGDEDLAHRMLYVEASRGCPFGCEFCLSSLDQTVRTFPLERLLPALERLLERGARHFKFVDRTFNLNASFCTALLDFFLERLTPGLFLHVEVVPDHLPEAIRSRLSKFPPGSLQLEIGVQTLNDEVAERIHRRLDWPRTEANLCWLREHTAAHIHADLIAGLPGETLASFGAGFDRLYALRPQEIQVGLLKRLRGAPICRHDEPWKMVYSPLPPYEVLQTGALPFVDVQRLRRFSRYWDLCANSGRFPATMALLLGPDGSSPFQQFLRLSDRLFSGLGQTAAIALPRLEAALRGFLVTDGGCSETAADEALRGDAESRAAAKAAERSGSAGEPPLRHVSRQQRHLKAARQL